MKNRTILFFLNDINNSLDKIFEYTANLNYKKFISSNITKNAVERNFEITGEATKSFQANIEINIPTFCLNRLQE